MSASQSTSRNVPLALAITVDGRPKYIIAAAAQLPAGVLSGVVSGRIIPSESQRKRLAAVLGRPEEELFAAVAFAGDAA